MDIPSYRVQAGDTIAVAPKMRENPNVLDALDQHSSVPNYLTFDRNTMSGRLVVVPERSEIPVLVDERLIVEHYSRRV